MNNAISEFYKVMRSTGLEPPEFIEPGKLHRFPGIGKRKNNQAGWCVLFEDEKGGSFGDWSSGLTKNWKYKPDTPYNFSPDEKASFKQRVLDSKAAANAARTARQLEAADRATLIWNNASSISRNHPYLISKNIDIDEDENKAREYKGDILLPIEDFNNKITSIQFIKPDGRKLLLAGGRKQDCFIHVSGNFADTSHVIICEGWATGWTLAQDDPYALVLAAIDAGNLKSVARSVLSYLDYFRLIIAGDDDQLTPGNPGATKAREAAIASGALLALPQWPDDAPKTLTDFNDLYSWNTWGVA